MPTAKSIGIWAEQLAKNYLLEKQLKIIAENFNSRFGEIDLIALHNEQLVFIEVRYRRNQDYGGAISSIGHIKQQRLIATAQFFLQQHPTHRDREMRFDVIAICDNAQENNSRIEWLRNAFET